MLLLNHPIHHKIQYSFVDIVVQPDLMFLQVSGHGGVSNVTLTLSSRHQVLLL